MQLPLYCPCLPLYLHMPILQAGIYDPWSDNEPQMAEELELTWDMRGPTDPSVSSWKGQKRRWDGAPGVHTNVQGAICNNWILLSR